MSSIVTGVDLACDSSKERLKHRGGRCRAVRPDGQGVSAIFDALVETPRVTTDGTRIVTHTIGRRSTAVVRYLDNEAIRVRRAAPLESNP